MTDDDGTVGPSADDHRLEALLGRLSELETGLRAELCEQVGRAERAESALAASQARALRAEVAGQASATMPAPASPVPEPSTSDRQALAAALREVRSYLERRQELEDEIVAVAREAVNALRTRAG